MTFMVFFDYALLTELNLVCFRGIEVSALLFLYGIGHENMSLSSIGTEVVVQVKVQ